MSQQYSFECTINWRIANNGFQFDKMNFEIDFDSIVSKQDGIIITLPKKSKIDVRPLRDWLHDNTSGFSMVGCYETDETGRTRFTGMKFGFADPIDAAFFRLAWADTTSVS